MILIVPLQKVDNGGEKGENDLYYSRPDKWKSTYNWQIRRKRAVDKVWE